MALESTVALLFMAGPGIGRHCPVFRCSIVATSRANLEQGKRIELSALAWKAKVLPLYEPCIVWLRRRESNPQHQLMRLVRYRFYTPRLLVPLTIIRSLC
jgi:hypothetical protein